MLGPNDNHFSISINKSFHKNNIKKTNCVMYQSFMKYYRMILMNDFFIIYFFILLNNI